ncbi:MAG: hypothetical protein Kow006_27920 [Gammaproteobacteria bacterium]
MNRIKHTATFEIGHPAQELFPLFSPEGEKLWVPGWDYENVMGGTELHEDYLFITRSHDHAASDAVWVVKRYQPEEYRVQFYKVEPGQKVGVVDVQCFEEGEGSTRVQVSYEYIGLSPEGDAFIEGFDEAGYRAFIGEWKVLLDRYLASVR